jgi:hypothetical protein
MTSSPGFHAIDCTTADMPALAPVVSAISAGVAASIAARDARNRFDRSKNVLSLT